MALMIVSLARICNVGNLSDPYNERFDMAILIVKRNEKAIRTRFSRRPRLVGLKTPRASSMKHPKEADAAWKAVRIQGKWN
jgi:hypothetical protein